MEYDNEYWAVYQYGWQELDHMEKSRKKFYLYKMSLNQAISKTDKIIKLLDK